MKRVLFIDRDGTLIEESADEKIDSFEKLKFLPGAIEQLARIAACSDYILVLVTNQDGLGTPHFPEASFWPVQDFIIQTLQGQGIEFAAVHIDKTFPHEDAPTRKPKTGMLTQYLNGPYDLEHSFVIGDRLTDVELAKRLGCKAIWINHGHGLGDKELAYDKEALQGCIACTTNNWEDIAAFLL
jgi:imidazoleglycerol-phosphate dehydratase/histidinol-phosphatase